MSLFEELKRRNVFRVGIAYVLLGWVVLQGADFALDLVDAPNWIIQVLFIIGLVGLPFALFFAWAFEVTPEGIKREADVDRSTSITPVTGRRLDRAIITFLALALVLVLADRFVSDRPPTGGIKESTDRPFESGAATGAATTAVEQDVVSVAVLPFLNMSEDPSNEYFSDGVSEELLNLLVRIEGLRVPSRTSSFTFKDSEKKVSEIGRELKVDHVLEGSVRKAGDRVRVTAQLIDVNTDTHLWSDTYTRELDDIFALQDEIAQAIVGALQVALTGEDRESLKRRSTSDVEAYNQFLLGRHLWNQRSLQGLTGAIEPLRNAVRLDPEFADAWAALADAYALIPEYKAGPIDEYVPLALEALERALNLQPDMARALTTRGYVKSLYKYDIGGAKVDLLRAIELEPDYATAHQWYGELLAVERRFDEALEEFAVGARLDPLAPIMWHVAGWVTSQADRLEEARDFYERALEINPLFEPSIANVATVYAQLGQYDRARELFRLYNEISGRNVAFELATVDAMEDPRKKPQALQMLAGDDVPDGALDKAYAYILIDEPELALQSLLLGFEKGDPYAIHANRVVYYDVLRDDPRFQQYLAKMNLWPPSEAQ